MERCCKGGTIQAIKGLLGWQESQGQTLVATTVGEGERGAISALFCLQVLRQPHCVCGRFFLDYECNAHIVFL